MSLESIRTDIVTAIETAKASFAGGYSLIIEYDNRLLIDTQTQVDPFLQVDIKVISAEQADLSDNPTHRFHGQIYLGAAVKEGAGVKVANDLLDFFYPRLQRKTLGSVRTHMATMAPVVPHLGWVYYPVIIPFWADKTY